MLKETLTSDFKNMQKSEIEDCVHHLFLLYKQMIDEERQLESLEKILKKEDRIIAYAYGAYISNQIARIGKEKEVLIEWESLQELKQLKSDERKRKLKKYAFANKDMFIKQIIEESKNNSKYKMGWTIDRNGRFLLNVNVTNYMQYPLKERKKKGFPEEIIISVHVLDPRLSKKLTELEKYPKKGSRPIAIFNPCDLGGR